MEGKIWINSSLNIICWLRLSKRWNSSSTLKNAVDYVICSPTNDDCQFPNWKCVLWNFTACTYIDIPWFEKYSSKRAPTIMSNTYMTQFTCSRHGILIREKITTYLDTKGTSKKTCFLCEQLIQSKTPIFTWGRMYEWVKRFSDFQKYFYIQQIEKFA